jgi:hypothetical protein
MLYDIQYHLFSGPVIEVSSFKGPNWVHVSRSHLRTETDPVSETLCFLVFSIPDEGQSPETQWFWAYRNISCLVARHSEIFLFRFAQTALLCEGRPGSIFYKMWQGDSILSVITTLEKHFCTSLKKTPCDKHTHTAGCWSKIFYTEDK